MKNTITLLLLLFSSQLLLANLKYHPVTFVLTTDKESYYEGEKITFTITITNTDTKNAHPVLIPHTQNTGQKLFFLNLYDRANNTQLLRYTEDKMLKMQVEDIGTVQIRYLKPLEQITIPIYLNDSEYYAIQNESNHSFGVPLFAGIYKVNLQYNPKGIALGDSIYSYYNDFDKSPTPSEKLVLSESGVVTQMIELKIKRSSDTIVSIEGQQYYLKTDGHRYYYFNEYVETISTDLRCIHITDLPADSCSKPNGEYFYSHFTDLFAEYINRFEDGDIREYRKFIDYCPDYLYTEQYNEFKQKTLFALQLPDKRFYKVQYNQPSGTKHWEIYCAPNGTLCTETIYFYNTNEELVKKKTSQTQPCIEIELEGQKRSYTKVDSLELRDNSHKKNKK
jgi:hypothetical protein